MTSNRDFMAKASQQKSKQKSGGHENIWNKKNETKEDNVSRIDDDFFGQEDAMVKAFHQEEKEKMIVESAAQIPDNPLASTPLVVEEKIQVTETANDATTADTVVPENPPDNMKILTMNAPPTFVLTLRLPYCYP